MLMSCDKAFQDPCDSETREQEYVQQHIRICTHGVKTFFCELYSHFNVRTGTQPSIRVMCINKCAWLSLALCEGCSHEQTLELALSWMGRVVEN